MKIRTLNLSIILLSVVLVLVAGQKGPKEEIHSTWVNPEYNNLYWAKVIFNPDGTWELYSDESYVEPGRTGMFTIVDKWADSEGFIYYKITIVIDIMNETNYHLYKLSNSESTLEDMFDSYDHPTEIDSNSALYRIYYRQ